MLSGAPLQVVPLKGFNHDGSFITHRHNFHMLLWVTAGHGLHRVSYRDHELLPGRVFFVQEGQVHQVVRNPADGWMVLFHPALFRKFLDIHPHQGQAGLFDFFSRGPYVILDEKGTQLFQSLIPLLEEEARAYPFSPCLVHYLSVLLFQASRLYRTPGAVVEDPALSGTLRKLKALLNEHFREQRTAPFYSARLGLPARKLNAYTKKTMGKLVHELVTDRLLSESEAMLGGTRLLMKEIIAVLGFADHAHFSCFFKKEKGMTPTAFRRQIQDGQASTLA